jgi:MarR family transcriptional regulator, temperature-dependent positive regulator of motility
MYDGVFMPKLEPDMNLPTPDLDAEHIAAPSGEVVSLPFKFDPNTSASHLLHRAQQVAADLHVVAFGANGLTQRQVAVLAALGAQDGVSQTDLVLKTGIDRSTLAEMVARMETKGLMVRTKSAQDSRANCVSLSPAGRKALEDALPKLSAIDQGVLAFLPASRREGLVDLLTRIALPSGGKADKKAAKESQKVKKKDKKKKDRKKKKAAKV